MEEGIGGRGRLEARGRQGRYVGWGSSHCYQLCDYQPGKDFHFSLAVQAFKGLILLHSDQKREELGQWREEERVSKQG